MRDVFQIAYELIYKHNLIGWSFRFDNAKSRAGLCIYKKKIISLSSYYVKAADLEEIINTILHEIAHAIVGPSHGHDSVWRAKALAIGCDAKRCHNLSFIVPYWVMKCPNGCFKIPRHRKKKQLICKSCNTPVIYVQNNV